MAADRVLQELTQTKLKLIQAQHEERAARLRARQVASVPTSHAAGALARDIRATQVYADDWAAILEVLAAAGLM